MTQLKLTKSRALSSIPQKQDNPPGAVPGGPLQRHGGSAGPGSMNSGAAAFVPGGGSGGLGVAMGRMRLGGGGHKSFQPPLPPGTPAWQGGGGAAYESLDGPDDNDEDWGYVDENGNWVSFGDDASGNREEVEFLKSQLPSEDDFLDGLGADTGAGYTETAADADEWGYYDDTNTWVSFGGQTSEYLQAAGGGR
jgi:hypothetical protein